MSRCNSLRLAICFLTAASVFPLATLGQSQDSQTQSVAEAARRAREKKKASEKQPAPVITDDILKRTAPAPVDANAPAPSSEAAPTAPAAPAAQAGADSGSAPDANAAPTPAEDPEQKAKSSAELTALKQQLAEAQKGLELLQRDLALQQDTYISNPDHSHDVAGKAKIDAMTQQISDKQQAVDALKSQLAALQASLSSSAPAPATTPPPPQLP
jgi:uncharacterized coiled-coil protein SlyX